MADYAHSDAAARSRAEKARRLAGFLWDRGITGTELLAMPAALRRKLARAAQTNPPSTGETWESVARLLEEKDVWAARHPDHPAAVRAHLDEKLLWVKPPITPWS
ncbi:hypothetical protein [Nocardia cyriacigeorgica]|uniref:hypothetical protein n=1 Tax=Nocardia cyriacigeorgica TaxID=135487 RepID=UPI00189350B7|nr:hypothetical protein [Nocardia cyriacigeorgica]MBF6095804.1 hypothetical protein [Nocardia cyriacigeorgica]MBF6415347.1 hypothetical protein [Nocardia cyriacigeorgica]MBF6496152.1 hypothetical protein [Nocardia cyriacigeorgica]